MKNESKSNSLMASHRLFLLLPSFPVHLPLPKILNIEKSEYKYILNMGPTTNLTRCLLTVH